MLSAITWAGGHPIPAHTLRLIARRCAGSGDSSAGSVTTFAGMEVDLDVHYLDREVQCEVAPRQREGIDDGDQRVPC